MIALDAGVDGREVAAKGHRHVQVFADEFLPLFLAGQVALGVGIGDHDDPERFGGSRHKMGEAVTARAEVRQDRPERMEGWAIGWMVFDGFMASWGQGRRPT